MLENLPVKKEERLRAPNVIWRRRLSEGVLNPICVVDRYIVTESGGYLYTFNTTDGTLADGVDFSTRMAGSDLYYFSFSGLDKKDIKGIVLTPGESASLKKNHIYDLSTTERIFEKNDGTAGVPLVVGGKAYFGFCDEWGESYVYAFDLEHRRVLWESRLKGLRIILKFSPSIDGEKLYVRTLSYLHALNIKDGQKVWSTKLTGKEKEEGYRELIYFSAPVVYSRMVYLFRDEYLIPYQPKTGETNYNSWRRYLTSIGLNAMEAGPNPILMRNRLYAAGGLYFVSGHLATLGGEQGSYSRVSLYDINTKKTLWEVDTGYASVERMVLGGKFLVTSDYEGRVLCMSSESGRLIWGGRLEGGVRMKPTIYFGRAFVGTDQGWLYCISL